MNSATKSADAVSSPGLLLPGIDGANPLGFLAALGLLRAVSAVAPSFRIGWAESAGSWRPCVPDPQMDADTFLSILTEGLNLLDGEPWNLASEFPFNASDLERATTDAIAIGAAESHGRLDLLAGFGVSLLQNDKGKFGGTALQMVRSGDSQGNGLCAYAAKLRETTTSDHLRTALFDTWTFDEAGCALRWSPEEHVGYAMQWNNPSGQPAKSVQGANRLAIESMGMLTVVPVQDKARTMAFTGRRQKYFTWPIWKEPINLNVVRSLISLAQIHDNEARRETLVELSERGISTVFQCQRVSTSTYYQNFTPAKRIA